MIPPNLIKPLYIKITILQIMTTQSNIDYRVNDAAKFVAQKGYGFKQISKLGQKSGQFKFASAEDLFEIQIIFKVPAIMSSMQMKAKFVDEVSVDMWYCGEKVLNQVQFIEKKEAVYSLLKFKFGEKSQRFDRAFVRFLNHPEPKQTQINYILFKGYKEQTSNKKLNAPKNVSDKDTFEPASKRKVIDEEKKIFDTRNKQKGVKKTSVQDLQMLAFSDRHLKKNINDQEAELKKVLQISKREQEEKLGKSGIKKKVEQDQFQKIPFDINEMQDNEFFDYDVVQWQKVKKVYEHVTPQWIQAQKKAQRQLNIQSRHSLSNKIKVKIFKDLQFCISNIVGTQKSKLLQKIKDLGGKTTDEPTNGCFVITNRMQGAKINLAKTLGSVKFVKPNYIEECHKLQARMDEKQYRP